MAERGREQFAALLGRRVHRHGRVRSLALHEAMRGRRSMPSLGLTSRLSAAISRLRVLRRTVPVHGRRGRVHEVPDGRLVALDALQQRQCGVDVGVRVQMRVGHRHAHAGARREVNDGRHTVADEDVGQQRSVVHVRLVEGERRERLGRSSAQSLEVSVLELRVVVRIQLVQTHHVVTAAEQTFGHMAADETCTSRQQNGVAGRGGRRMIRRSTSGCGCVAHDGVEDGEGQSSC